MCATYKSHDDQLKRNLALFLCAKSERFVAWPNKLSGKKTLLLAVLVKGHNKINSGKA